MQIMMHEIDTKIKDFIIAHKIDAVAFVPPNSKKRLLIDGPVCSGSTLNQIAEKIKNKQVAKRVTGLAIVASFKGFDVITDV